MFVKLLLNMALHSNVIDRPTDRQTYTQIQEEITEHKNYKIIPSKLTMFCVLEFYRCCNVCGFVTKQTLTKTKNRK